MSKSLFPFPLGWMEEANLDILAVEGGADATTTRYRVRYPCCGAEASIAHNSVLARRSVQRLHPGARPGCPTCAKVANARQAWTRAKVRRATPVAPPSLVDRLWRRPPSLAAQPLRRWWEGAPLVWEGAL
jgi:hypothetical protein